jgi:hypothetical protein
MQMTRHIGHDVEHDACRSRGNGAVLHAIYFYHPQRSIPGHRRQSAVTDPVNG